MKAAGNGRKRATITGHFRELIAAGGLKPGDRLPTRVEIERAFSASPTTVQGAMRRLMDDGFVSARGRRGTFVSSAPPHLSRYVLAFPIRPGQPGWVRFWTVLRQVAESRSAGDGPRVSTYSDVAPEKGDGDYHRLLADVHAHRLAGVIFGTDPWPLAGSPVMKAEWLPRVAFVGPPGIPGVAGVSLGGRGAFFERALDLLAERGRKRIGLITVPGISGDRLDCFRDGLARRGMTCLPQWIQSAHQSDPKWAARITLLMFAGRAGDRPDGLIIVDDNLVEHACSGIVQAGVVLPGPSGPDGGPATRAGPGDLDVVAHCNFPARAPSVLPIHRLGYDIRTVFETCVELLERQRAGEKVPRITTAGPVFETEIGREENSDLGVSSASAAAALTGGPS